MISVNTLQLTLIEDPDFKPCYYTVKISIDGKDLISELQKIELSQLEPDDTPDVTGMYMYLPARMTLPPSLHFLGDHEESGIVGYEDYVPILLCECGNYGCWDFLCKMHFNNDTVTWSDFTQVNRAWSYAALDRFEFDRKQYEEQFLNPEFLPWTGNEEKRNF